MSDESFLKIYDSDILQEILAECVEENCWIQPYNLAIRRLSPRQLKIT